MNFARFLSLLLMLNLAACAALGNAPAPTQTAPPTHTAAPSPTSTPPPTKTNTPIPTATVTPEPGFAKINPVDNARLLFIPAGEFQVGSNDGYHDESPVHMVDLDAYWMYETEVTNAQFAQFVGETGHNNAGSSNDASLAQHPVTNVSWNDAVAYCRWVGGRLPTEAEWEKAARGTDGRTYPWGDTWNARNASSVERVDGYQRTAPVGRFPGGVSPYGLQDMAGNVWEWVADWYASDYYSNSPASNPTGPASGEYRVARGGSWYDRGGNLKSAVRSYIAPVGTFDNVGFRCASSTAP